MTSRLRQTAVALLLVGSTGCVVQATGKRATSVARYHDAIVNQLLLASPRIPADRTAAALRAAEQAMVDGCEAVDAMNEGSPPPGEAALDRCEETSAEVDRQLRLFVPGRH